MDADSWHAAIHERAGWTVRRTGTKVSLEQLRGARQAAKVLVVVSSGQFQHRKLNSFGDILIHISWLNLPQSSD